MIVCVWCLLLFRLPSQFVNNTWLCKYIVNIEDCEVRSLIGSLWTFLARQLCTFETYFMKIQNLCESFVLNQWIKVYQAAKNTWFQKMRLHYVILFEISIISVNFVQSSLYIVVKGHSLIYWCLIITKLSIKIN